MTSLNKSIEQKHIFSKYYQNQNIHQESRTTCSVLELDAINCLFVSFKHNCNLPTSSSMIFAFISATCNQPKFQFPINLNFLKQHQDSTFFDCDSLAKDSSWEANRFRTSFSSAAKETTFFRKLSFFSVRSFSNGSNSKDDDDDEEEYEDGASFSLADIRKPKP